MRTFTNPGRNHAAYSGQQFGTSPPPPPPPPPPTWPFSEPSPTVGTSYPVTPPGATTLTLTVKFSYLNVTGDPRLFLRFTGTNVVGAILIPASTALFVEKDSGGYANASTGALPSLGTTYTLRVDYDQAGNASSFLLDATGMTVIASVNITSAGTFLPDAVTILKDESGGAFTSLTVSDLAAHS